MTKQDVITRIKELVDYSELENISKKDFENMPKKEVLELFNEVKEKNMQHLKVHERFKSSFLGIYIVRVPSGFIYDCWDEETRKFKLGIFVPL